MDENKKTLDFASLGEMAISAKTGIGSSTGSKYTKSDINTYLDNIPKYATNLRQASDYFYNSSGIYKNIINAFSNLATLDNIILPSSKTLQRSNDKSYQGYFDKVNSYADSINIKSTTRNILKSVAKYGAYIAYERNEGTDYYLQQLPMDYCRIKYRVGNDFQLEFNFKYFEKFFQKEDLDFAWMVYPKEFKSLYNKYKKDAKSRNPEWQMLDIKKTVCITADDDDVYFVPMYSGMFEAILNNEDYKDLIKIGQTLDISKLLVQKVPTDKDGNILMPKEGIQFFHNELKKILPEGANGVTTPLEISDVSFSNQNQSKQDLLDKAERNAFVNSGFSSSIFSDNGGNTGLQLNVEYVTSNVYATLEKIEDMFNRKFKNVANTKNYEFKIKFFRTTNININENFDRMYKLLSIGGAIQPLFSLMGFDADTYMTLLQVENDLGIKDLLQVPQSMHTQNGASDTSTNPDKQVGNPKKSEKDVTDAGMKSRNADTGVN